MKTKRIQTNAMNLHSEKEKAVKFVIFKSIILHLKIHLFF